MDRLEYASDHVKGVAANWLPTALATLGAWAASFWSRIPWPIITVMILIVCDFIFATWNARRRDVFCWKILREGLVGKIGYKTMVLAAAQSLAHQGNPVFDGFSGFIIGGIGVLEFKSVVRNVDELNDGRVAFFGWLRRHLDAFDIRTGLKGLAAVQKPGTPLEVDQDGSVIRLHGEIDHSNVEALKDAVTDAIERHGRVTFDASDLRFIDSSGLSVLFTAVKQAEGNDLPPSVVVVRGADKKLSKLLVITGFAQTITVEMNPPSDDAP